MPSPSAKPVEEWRVAVRDPAEAEAEEITPEQSVIERLRSMTAADGVDRMKVKIYRQKANKTGLEYCAEYSVPEFEAGDLTMLRDQWGPGDYQIRVIGSKGVAMRENVSVATPHQAAQIPVSAATNDMANMLKIMLDSQNAILQALSVKPDPAAEMQKTFALMAGMREAMGLNIQQAAHVSQSPSTMLGELVGAIKMLRDVSEDISPKPAPDVSDNPMSMLPQVLELVKVGMSRAPERIEPMQIPGSFAEAAKAESHQNDSHLDNKEDIGAMVLKGLMQQLLQYAESKADVEVGAGFIADKLPDEMIQYIELPNWFDFLQMFDARCAAHKEWLTKCRDRAIELLSDSDDGVAH
jgi:hypothetical protein